MGLGEELKGHNYGSALADALSKIGQSVKEARQTTEAQDIIREHIPKLITGDMGSNDFRQKFAETLATAAGMMPDVGEKVTGAVKGALDINKIREAQVVAGVKAAKDEYDVSYQGYVQALKTPNAEPEGLKSWYKDLVEKRRHNAESFQGYGMYFEDPPPPVPVRDKSAVDFQKQGLTEYGALTVGYDKKANRNMVTMADGTIVPYDQRIHGRILQTQIPRSISEVEGALTPEARKIAARVFIATGQMPTGVRSAVAAAQVLNEVAQVMQESGLAAKDVPTVMAAYKSTSAALAAVEKQYNMVSTFEQTAQKNLAYAIKMSEGVPRFESPLANEVKLWWKRNIKGDKALAEFEAGLRVAATEIAKVTSTVTGNVLAQQQIEEFNSLVKSSMSMKAIKGVGDVFKFDMNSRLTSYQAQIKELKKQLSSPYLNDLNDGEQIIDGKRYILKGGEWLEQP